MRETKGRKQVYRGCSRNHLLQGLKGSAPMPSYTLRWEGLAKPQRLGSRAVGVDQPLLHALEVVLKVRLHVALHALVHLRAMGG